MRERDVESYLVSRVTAAGGEVRKLKWIGRNNAMDRFVALNGKSAFIEVKRPGKKPTAAQERERKRFEAQGVFATWVNCYSHVDRMVDFLMDRVDPLDVMLGII